MKEYIWYIAVVIAVVLLQIAGALALLPVMLAVAFVGFWVFDVK